MELPERKYARVCVGGTFDVPIHKGHKDLLEKAFSLGGFVIIGLTTQKYLLYSKKHDLDRIKPYEFRKSGLEAWLNVSGFSERYKITPLHSKFRRELLEDKHLDYCQAIIVSPSKFHETLKLNEEREGKGFDRFDIVQIETVLAYDGTPVSSTRIRNGEIDTDGNSV